LCTRSGRNDHSFDRKHILHNHQQLTNSLATALDHILPLATPADPRTRSLRDEARALLDLPFNDLLFKAQTTHRENFDPNRIQRSTLLSIKTGGCPEDCGYCPQSARHATGVDNEAMLPLDEVVRAAQAAKDNGATRFCMGAA